VQAVPDVPGLSLLGTGPIPAGRTELLGLPEAGEILRTLADLFDVVIIDSPPLPVADALVLASYADAIVLIVAAGETKTRQVEWATELLRHVAAPRGIVLNKVIRGTRNRIEYSHDYRHQEDVRRSPEPFVVRSS
jgi:Mrp family chromosome partitioning ATPase